MKFLRLIYYSVGIILFAFLALVNRGFLSREFFHHEPLHSTLETVGAVIALIFSHLLFLSARHRKRSYILWVRCALISMGVLHLAHTIVRPGESFVWLDSSANLAGGLFFALVWTPEKHLISKSVKFLPATVFFFSVITALSAIFSLGTVPAMLQQGEFTDTAKMMNLFGGLLFLFSSGWFYSQWQKNRALDEMIFAGFALLFGCAGMIFGFSRLWETEWWIWQLMHFFGYLLVVFLVFELFRESEQALQSSEEMFRNTFDQAAVGVAHVSPDGSWLRVNQRLCELTGYSQEEMMRLSFQDITHPDDLGPELNYRQKLLRGSIPNYTVEKRYIRKDGSLSWVTLTVSCVKLPSGQPDYCISVIEDISGRKKVEDDLTHSREMLNDAQEIAHLGSWEWDIATGHEVWSDEQFRIFGYKPGEIKPTYDLFVNALHPEDREKVLAAVKNTFAHDTPYRIEFRILLPDKSEKTIQATGLVFRDEKKQPRKMIGTVLDITDRKIMENAIREREKHFRTITETATDAIISVDRNRKVILWNNAAAEMFGYSYEEARGKTLPFIMAEEVRQAHEEGMMRVLTTGESKLLGKVYESTALRRDGTSFPVEISLAKWELNDEPYFTGIIRDISERKKAEQALTQKEEQIRHLLNSTAEGIYGLDMKGNCTFCNPSCLSLLRYKSADELLGRNMHDLIHHTKPDGTPYRREECRIYLAFREGKGIHEDTEVLWRADGSGFPAEYWSHPIVSSDGTVTGAVVTFVDITERRQTTEALERFSDTQTVLLREVNHRVKNNLAVIISMLHKEEDRAKEKGLIHFLPVLSDLTGRIKGLLTVHSMLSSARWQPLRLTELCEQITRGVIRSHGKDIDLGVTASDVLIDSDQAHHLTLVINELATNSLKYGIPPEKRARIDIDLAESDDRMIVRFRDNGRGYPENIISGDYNETSIGFTLITGIVRTSLRGTVSFRNEEGAVAEMAFAKTVQTRRESDYGERT